MQHNLDKMHRNMVADLLDPPTEGTVRWQPRTPPANTPEPEYKVETATIRVVTHYRVWDEVPNGPTGEYDPRIGRKVIEAEVQDGARTDQ